VLLREPLRDTIGLRIDDEVDVALPMERDVLAPVPGGDGETHPREQRPQQLGIGRGVLNELKPVNAYHIRLLGVGVARDRLSFGYDGTRR
jgi:hypothetical protein